MTPTGPITPSSPSLTAFEGQTRIASGLPADVALAVRLVLAGGGQASVLIFDDATGRQIDLDLRGSDDEIRARYGPGEETAAPRRPGRPKLGVVAREVTLLPRHWEWLSSQPGGASVALRKLVEEARRANASKDAVRLAREAAYRFTTAMAGNEPGYEEAARALFAGDEAKFNLLTGGWPDDIRDHARKLAGNSFGA